MADDRALRARPAAGVAWADVVKAVDRVPYVHAVTYWEHPGRT
jgi:hypothetical protein